MTLAAEMLPIRGKFAMELRPRVRSEEEHTAGSTMGRQVTDLFSSLLVWVPGKGAARGPFFFFLRFGPEPGEFQCSHRTGKRGIHKATGFGFWGQVREGCAAVRKK